MTGGRFELEQHGGRRLHQGWLRGRFRLRLLPYLVARPPAWHRARVDRRGPEVRIDYPPATRPEELADEAKRLEDHGLLQHEIAAALGIYPRLAGRALDLAYARLGRRAGRPGTPQALDRKQARLPRYVAWPTRSSDSGTPA